ncbi:MAG: YbaB/EbfC family nucleoid-associated protein [Spirochaetaceae bacterium]|jgi:DNA-binding YbaB/EbfC family protein|nr:YbaB/EbfC family nucleoid-associated protein [Spirochaetaceae bacterium]
MNINPFDILKNAQKIQEQMGAFQEKLGALRSTGSAGGGMVEIDLNGRMEMLALRIAPEAMDSGGLEMVQDLIIAAYTDGLEKIKEVIPREMSALTGGFFPGKPGGV